MMPFGEALLYGPYVTSHGLFFLHQLLRIPLPRRWVNRRYDARSVDDPGYTDTMREDFREVLSISYVYQAINPPYST
jgi:hypothetical protein